MTPNTLVSGLTLSFIVLGCATTQIISLSDSERKSVRSVSVARDIAMPPYPLVMGPASSGTGFIFGPIAQAVASQIENSDSVQFKKHLDENGIDIKEIVRQEFVTHLTASKAFPEVVAENGQAIFELTVESYGLGPGFSMRPINKPLRPTLRLRARLSTPDGKVLWQNSAYITGMAGGIPSYQIDDYYSNPSRTRDAFKKAAEVLVKELLNDIVGSPSIKQGTAS